MNINSRYLSLDVFRGLTICFMIIVNTAGNWDCVYGPLQHAAWHGFTPTDLVFPSFLFAVGSSIYFSQQAWSSMISSAVLKKIVKRTALIFLVGYFLFWFPFFRNTAEGLVFKSFEHTRIMGVLQRIGLCFGFASILIYYIKSFKSLFMLSVGLLLGYWAIMVLGGDYSMLGNIGHKLDLAVLGDKHLYHGEGVAFDPEGLLSTMPSIVNVLAGYLVTRYLVSEKIHSQKLVRILIFGLGLLIVSWVWNTWFPINKKIWTSSFVLQTVGWDMLILTILVYLIDILNLNGKYFSFFHIAGKNPLFLYLVSEVVVILLLFFKASSGASWYSTIYTSLFGAMNCHLGSFLFSFLFMLFCWLCGWWMHRKGWILKL